MFIICIINILQASETLPKVEACFEKIWEMWDLWTSEKEKEKNKVRYKANVETHEMLKCEILKSLCWDHLDSSVLQFDQIQNNFNLPGTFPVVKALKSKHNI